MAAVQTLAGTVKIQTALNYINTLDDEATITDAFAKSFLETYTSGATGALKVNCMFHNRYSIAGHAEQALDLSGGLTNSFGTFSFTKVMAIIIKNVTTTAGHTLSFGGGEHPLAGLTDAAGDMIVIGAGGMFCLTHPQEGLAVTGGSADDIKLHNNHATVLSLVDVCIIGVGTVA